MKRERYLNCKWCGDYHLTEMIRKKSQDCFKGDLITYPKLFLHCQKSDIYYETKNIKRINQNVLADYYRKKHGLLTNTDIENFILKMEWSYQTLSEETGIPEERLVCSLKKQVLTKDEDRVVRTIMMKHNYATEFANPLYQSIAI